MRAMVSLVLDSDPTTLAAWLADEKAV